MHRRFRRYSTALDALTSVAWMLPSEKNAGLSASEPVEKSVTVAIQMSRPSYDLPIDSSRTKPGYSSAKPCRILVRSS